MKEFFCTVVALLRMLLAIIIIISILGILDFLSNPLKFIR